MGKSLDKFAKSMKGKYFGKDSLIHNNIVLYVVFVIALINFLGYVMVGDVRHVIIFALTGFIVSCMSKNMVVILSIAMAITAILKVSMGRTERFEGLEDNAGAAEKMQEEAEAKVSDDVNNGENPSEEKKENSEGGSADKEKLQEIKKDGKELIKLQDKIIDGFNEIEPYMKKAEGLSDKIQKTAETIQGKI